MGTGPRHSGPKVIMCSTFLLDAKLPFYNQVWLGRAPDLEGDLRLAIGLSTGSREGQVNESSEIMDDSSFSFSFSSLRFTTLVIS